MLSAMKVCGQCGLKYPDDETRCFVDSTVLETADDPFLGATLAGRYLVEEVIGTGGMATVYRARHTLVDRPVAVKIMSGSLARDESLRERFRREAKNAAALAHPHIIEIYDYGEGPENSVFLVMELLKGASLADFMDQGPIEPAKVAALGLQIAQGLARAHDFDVIHRDLKPENIFVCDAGADRVLVKLLDFGLARSMHDSRLTSQGQIFGTPQYMAPESITSIEAGPGADLYALGIILFEMITGRLPFESKELTGYFIHHLQTPPPKPSEIVASCPRRMEELILKLLEKKPEERPVDAHAVIKELQALVPTSGVTVPPLSLKPVAITAPTLPPTTAERWARRAIIFNEMLRTAYPNDPPAEAALLLDEVRGALQRMTTLRSKALREQRRIEELEGHARENRARLGHAVQSLAEDLSLARENARQAGQEVAPYLDADEQAVAGYREAHGAVSGYHLLEAPDDRMAKALRDLADSIAKWSLSFTGAEKARAWIASRAQDVKDLEFQVLALRSQLERTETEHDANVATVEKLLVDASGQATDEERHLMQIGRQFCDALRGNPALREHFVRLEQEGG
ncbi:MAG: tRNA A-37 threonylcarbamoyl transferase component Bud32 [Polyangiales bacterium]|jgi:tRNA A-37 threonylcarbamoyl transferase component Bud32